MRLLRSVSTALLMFGLACAKDAGNTLLTTLGLTDPVPLRAERIIVLCDPSPGSSCTTQTLEAVIDEVIRHAALHPGTSAAVYGLGNSIADTRLLTTDLVRAPIAASSREALQDLRAYFVKDSFKQVTGWHAKNDLVRQYRPQSRYAPAFLVRTHVAPIHRPEQKGHVVM